MSELDLQENKGTKPSSGFVPLFSCKTQNLTTQTRAMLPIALLIKHTVTKPIVVLGALALLLFIAGCSGYNHHSYTPPPPSIKNPPIYPGAQTVKIEPEGTPEPVSERRVTLETSAKPDEVL